LVAGMLSGRRRGLAVELDAVGVVDQAVEDGIGEGGLTEVKGGRRRSELRRPGR
jgi:hypothetical protein